MGGLNKQTLNINEQKIKRKELLRDPIYQTTGTFKDFSTNLLELKYFNKNKKSDKFYHCKANCEASQRGRLGENIAVHLSDAKEAYDQTFKRFPKSDSDEDQIANSYGRKLGRENISGECKKLCNDVDKFFKR